ncbi:uncharacterized protein LOC113005768 [Solenopsis invicta]|uniref:uncharacterized protein LOC113005768 n=1 Tax=Solenopsis invicta TaxID=13686 RepID=UPI00193D02A4|nr:uncharacterized protein LOC113005768 [Solenopsis invicta]
MNNSEKQLLVEELHAPARRNFPRRHVIVRGYDNLWQADVVEMRPYMRFNRGYHYILTVIDVLSKYAWAVPLKAKSGNEVANAINDMWKQFTLNGNYKWIDLLPRLVLEYNSRRHRTIDMRPINVTPAIAEKLLSTVYSCIKIAAPARFKVDELVRVSKFKTIFDKGYTPNWTTKIFKIAKVQRTNPVTYLLKDSCGKHISGGFYEYELQRVACPAACRAVYHALDRTIGQCAHHVNVVDILSLFQECNLLENLARCP